MPHRAQKLLHGKRASEASFAKSKLELVVFDKTTENMGVADGSKELKQRASARSDLVALHRKSAEYFIGKYHQHHDIGGIAQGRYGNKEVENDSDRVKVGGTNEEMAMKTTVMMAVRAE